MLLLPTSVSQIDTLRDSFAGGLFPLGDVEPELDRPLLGLEAPLIDPCFTEALLEFSNSGVAELRRSEAKLSSSPTLKLFCLPPGICVQLVDRYVVVYVLGVCVSLLRCGAWFSLSLLEASLDLTALMLGLFPCLSWGITGAWLDLRNEIQGCNS